MDNTSNAPIALPSYYSRGLFAALGTLAVTVAMAVGLS